ncbi:MAG TPA: amylo-alpha-1,6-glucosidase [Spirochaetota bacterium]|nr:amylo-alpha-1,6-glucosidase [Spirochaetota bacterium]
MYRNIFLKLATDSKDKRFVVTDNYFTYFTVSDFKDDFDGLWSGGFHLFNSLNIGSANSKIKHKSQTLTYIEADFDNKIALKFYLLKKSDGLIINFANKSFISRKIKKVNCFLKIESHYNIIEHNSNYIIIEYDKPERLGFGFDKFYCVFLSTTNFIFENVVKSENIMNFDFITKQKVEKEPEILVLYGFNLTKLKKQIEYSKDKTINLKKQHIRNSLIPFTYSSFETEDKTFDKALVWATYSANGFVMQKNDTIGLWAGLQWFDNSWGRDTFISLPGVSLVSGRYEEAKHIIENFTRYQCNNKKSDCFGKIPNVIFSENRIIFNTADATPLLIREIYEYFLYTGDYNFILNMWHTIKLVIDTQYLAKKDENYFVTHKDSDDWMDAKKDDTYSYSPRGDKAIEIQSLWYVSLYVAFNIGKEIIKYRETNKMPLPDNIKINELRKDIKKYKTFADKLKKSFSNFFTNESEPFLFDHINSDYSKDTKIRPNPFLAIYYSNMIGIPPLFERDKIIKFLKFALPKIVYINGVSSLDKNDIDFHPINNSPLFHKDAAYHNGMIWTFLSGAIINVATSFGLQNFIYQQTQSLVDQILNVGALGTLSELVYPYQKTKNEIITAGTYSQTWSLAEFSRSFYKDYLGINLNVPKRKIYLSPSIPIKLGFVKTNIRFGFYETVNFNVLMDNSTTNVKSIVIKAIEINKPIFIIIKIKLGYEKIGTKFKYKTQFVKIKLSDNNDIFKIEFIEDKTNLIKIKSFNIFGSSQILSLEMGYEISDTIYENNLKYATSIGDLDLKNYKSMTEDKYLEKKITAKDKI